MSAREPADDRKRSVTVAGHRTSVSLEDEFWQALGDIAGERGMSVSSLIAEIDENRGPRGLSAAIRVHVLAYFRDRRGPERV
ncbi:ribbon-helix-helix domain-containing protein [Microbaculum marinisediminis]|uniref:Ribbon-helix-helix domain-containing protein n=1 Tax=Microbaculum marinisediminis TaxID=2931392 RepID=A0AAW5QX56_9HYPH|nr:ribbon-helix-helix domain-containing protein [Microbaculum sp. A6E488]MCT8972641.1 ribbon-helix-helix domain-containing protein [Microbaculum sp. A6E488]